VLERFSTQTDLHNHLTLQLDKPSVDSTISFVIFVVFVQGQANKLVADDGFRILNMDTVSKPVAEQLQHRTNGTVFCRCWEIVQQCR
jgi:hypothetical protein